MRIYKFRLSQKGKYTEVNLFIAPEENQTFQHAGVLRLDFGEWQELGTCFLMGEQIFNRGYNYFKIVIEGEREVIECLSKK